MDTNAPDTSNNSIKLKDIYNNETRKGILRYLTYLWIRYNNKNRDEQKANENINLPMDISF